MLPTNTYHFHAKLNHHTTHYLDLSLSLNHFTITYHIVHYQIYQKPHHKYMYPHFSSNHPHHVFSGIIKTETLYDTVDCQLQQTTSISFTTNSHSAWGSSFSIDNGDSTKNVTFKMNSSFFKLCCVYSNSLKMSNVGKFPWS